MSANFRSGYTKVENYFFDYVMPRVSCAEWKTICAVLRETVGWNRPDAEITLDRFMALTGFARQAMSAAIRRSVARSVIERRTVQQGRQRTFKYRAIPKANLRALPAAPPRRLQSALPFDVAEFESKVQSPKSKVEAGALSTAPAGAVENAGQNVTEFENQTASTEFENQTPNGLTEFENQTSKPLVLRSIKDKDLRERHTHRAALRQPGAPVEKSATGKAGSRACESPRGSRFTKKQVREYAWASHNFDQFLVEYYEARGKKNRVTVGIKSPDAWATPAHRSGEHDDEIQEWLDHPEILDPLEWRMNRMSAG